MTVIVTLPDDEYLARVPIVAWLAYPHNQRFRRRAIEGVQDWARKRLGLPLSGRRNRVENALRELEREMDNRLLVGEFFRRQVLMQQHNDGFFGRVSTKGISEQLATGLAEARSGAIRAEVLEPTNVIRDYWTKGRASLSLAVGVCNHWPPHGYTVDQWKQEPRPSLETLLWTERNWSKRAITIAEEFRQLAIELNNPSASHLIEFRLARI